MASYVELIRKDVFRHTSCDASSWPFSVSEFGQSLQNALKIPSWFKKYASDGVIDLLDQLCPDDASNVDLWDTTDTIMDKETERRLCAVFNTALVDCARIRAVIEAEDITDTPFPKESFLVILVRNAILEAHTRLYSLEDIPVVLPRHFSGEAIPILKYIPKNFYAPLVISIGQEMPVEENESGLGHQLSDVEEDTSSESGLFEHSPPTLSEWLDACERTKTPEEVEEEQEAGFLSPHFEPYFLAYSPSTTPPSICHVPVLCMANEEQLPVLMSSLLYQRRVWHISDPLIGLEFSKYDTTIKLVLGWLEEDPSSSRALPRVHLGEIRTPVSLDLSLPSVALVISRLLCSLESHICGVRDSARHSVGAVISETRSHPSLSWRIDTDYFEKEGSAPILENNNTRDMIIQWVESQKYSVPEDLIMRSRKQDATSLSGSATSSPTPQHSTSTQLSNPLPPLSLASEGTDLSIPEIREPGAQTSSNATYQSRLSCSEFAATSEKNDYRLFRWMFDRRVAPQSIPVDLKFREEYSAMTGFIWPETWNSREDLPLVDAALEPCIQELLESVAVLKMRQGAVKCIPVNEFPVDLRILKQSFSAIFQASRRSREKTEHQVNLCEAAWRHDHDRLLFDFFIRLVQPTKGDTTRTLIDGHSISHLEDPLSRPTLETTLRLPKSDNFQAGDEEELDTGIQMLLERRATDIKTWLKSHGRPPKADRDEFEHSTFVRVHFTSWRRETNEETEALKISKLSQVSSTGRCDALGRLLVELPDVSPNAVHHFPLVVRPARKSQGRKGAKEVKASSSKSGPPTSTGSLPSSSLTIPVGSPATNTQETGTRYTMPSSSVSTSMHPFDNGQTRSSESVDALAYKVKQLQLGTDAPCLELPILTAEYKKASDNLMKGTNQLRMYLTASVKFLQAIGITNIAVYGVQTDGPIVVLPAAILGDDNFVHLFERLVEKLDISTPVGAWHYATILCRLAQNHAKDLEKKFEEVRDNLVTSLQNGDQMEGWTLEHQMNKLKVKKKATSPGGRR
ncbi:hypothetical protein V8E55_001106 [Tylopilus felleus]